MAEASEITQARRRVEQARAELGTTVRQIGSRVAPGAIAGSALSRLRAGKIDWLGLGLRLYRHRGGAMMAMSAITALRAWKRRKKPGEDDVDSKGVSDVTSDDHADTPGEDTVDKARRKLSGVKATASRKASEAKTRATETANAAYNYSRNTGTKLTHKIASGVQEHPLSVVLGSIALGALAAVVVPRLKSAGQKAEGVPLDELRDKASETARETFQAIGDKLDDLGISRENAREMVNRVRDIAIDTASQAASAAQDAISRARRDH